MPILRAVILLLAMSVTAQAQAAAREDRIMCRASAGSGSGWMWRQIAGRRCWFPGGRSVAKDRLYWPAAPVATPAPARAVLAAVPPLPPPSLDAPRRIATVTILPEVDRVLTQRLMEGEVWPALTEAPPPPPPVQRRVVVERVSGPKVAAMIAALLFLALLIGIVAATMLKKTGQEAPRIGELRGTGLPARPHRKRGTQ